MPRRALPETAEDKAIREIAAEDDAAINKLALEAGPPPDSEQLSDAQLDTIWAIEDRFVRADPDRFSQTLMTTGLDQQTLARLRVLKEHPEWAPFYAQPTQDAEMADQLTRHAEFPHRWSLLMDIDDPDEMVRTAERLDRRYQKAHAGAPVEETPIDMPVAPPPMPVQQAAPQPPVMPQQQPMVTSMVGG